MSVVSQRAGRCRFWSRGYTLLETAVVIGVAGIMIASAAAAYNIYIKTQQQLTTENNATQIIGAFGSYLVRNGSYPCPARLDAKRSDADYGISTDCTDDITKDTQLPPSATAILPGNCSSGICIETGTRLPLLTLAANYSDLVAAGKGSVTRDLNRVRRGMVPFRTLGLPEDTSLDGWNTRFQYAVTEILADPLYYKLQNGEIDIRGVDTGNYRPMGSPSTSLVVTAAQQLILPPQESGSINSTGGSAHFLLISSGPDRAGGYTKFGEQMSACPTGTMDAENCNTGVTGTDLMAYYRLAPYSTGTGAEHFDDVVKFFSTVETPLWKTTDTTGYHITDLAGADSGGKIGVAKTNPQMTLDVGGTLMAEQFMQATNYCPYGNKSACFTPSFTASCPAGQFATAIGTSTAALKCTSAGKTMCAAGKVMIGFNTNGKILCAAINGCPSMAVTLCNPNPSTGSPDIRTIPAGRQGDTWTSTPVSGDSYWRTYTCSSGSVWTQTSSGGQCYCTAGSVPFTKTCDTIKGSIVANQWVGTGSSCTDVTTCGPYSFNETCGSYTCACNDTGPIQQTRPMTCPTGQSGTWTQANTWTCNVPKTSGSWSGWVDVVKTCACDPSITDSATFTCQTVPNPPYATPYSAGYISGNVQAHRNITCPAGTWGNWTVDSDTCACSNWSKPDSYSCAAPLTGTIYGHETFDCTTNTWGTFVEDSDTCSIPATTWHAGGSQTSSSSTSGPQLGSPCTGSGSTSSCYSAQSGSSYWIYSACQCY